MTAAVKFTQSEKANAARTDIERMLKRLGCDAVHIVDDIERCELRLVFERKGVRVVLPVSARTWTGIFLRLRPWKPDNRMSQKQYHENAARQGLMAISPMLKVWLSGQVVAVENGLMPFEQAFMPGIDPQDDNGHSK